MGEDSGHRSECSERHECRKEARKKNLSKTAFDSSKLTDMCREEARSKGAWPTPEDEVIHEYDDDEDSESSQVEEQGKGSGR